MRPTRRCSAHQTQQALASEQLPSDRNGFNDGVGLLGRPGCANAATDHHAAQEDHDGNDRHRHEHEDELFSVQLYFVNALV